MPLLLNPVGVTGNVESISPFGQPATAAYSPSSTSAAYTLGSNVAQSNLMASPYNVKLADLVNATNRAAQSAANASRLGPQGAAIQNQILGNVAAGAAGKLAPGTINTMEDVAAQRGVAGGFGVDSPNINAALLRSLGLTAEEQQAKAASQYSQLLAENPSAPIYGMQNLLVSPGEYASVASAQAAAQRPTTVSGGGGGGGGGRTGGGYVPSAAESNMVPYGGGYPGAGTATGSKYSASGDYTWEDMLAELYGQNNVAGGLAASTGPQSAEEYDIWSQMG